tara:strand:+ start:140 stop:373 length:234 start_codon:yes stop_codon:yes gene_type:complete
MLQKIVNGIAITSGLVSLAIVGTVGYVYVRKDAIIENFKSKVIESVLPSVPLPTLPDVTGGAKPLPASPQSPVPMPF